MNRIETDLDGTHAVFQPETGFHFGIDALLLAGAAFCRAGDAACDLGTGCGVIPVLLSMHRDFARIYGVEIREDLAALARENAEKNGFGDRIRILSGDLKNADALLPEKVDVVLANPPYRRGSGDPARFESLCGIRDVCRAAASILKGKGRFTVIWPVRRLADLFRALADAGLEPKEMIPVVPVRGRAAKLVLVTSRKGVLPGLAVSPAFVLREADGRESEACLRLYEDGVLGVEV